MKFQLEIQQIGCTCLFKLKWDREKQISTVVSYPNALSELYRAWRKAYLDFYKTALRARVRKIKNDGKISLPQDRHRQLVQIEAQLLEVFYSWLRSEDLYKIRSKIAIEGGKDKATTALFITCSGELERLPWETWELGAEFDRSVAIVRSPTNITSSNQNTLKSRRKPRILVLLGDDTGLDLNGDRTAINTLKQIAEVELVTWNNQQSITEIKQQIQRALTDAKGWEVLFFAGHSNDTAITGGEIAIAPHLALSVNEIADGLKVAQANGLQFALFNSCSGLSIANSLIDLGLSQVVVMREPVHNQVAQVFLVQFLQALADGRNVQQALVSAKEQLKQEKQKLIYPSAYLIPSLFCHPEARLYRIQPWGWRKQLKQWLPSRREAIAASALCLLSIMPPVQNYLLDKRTLVQSIYGDVTEQLPTAEAPVTLIHIDEESLRKAEIDRPVPMDRQYLARLVDRLVAAEVNIIGIDYLFDRSQPQNDPILAKSIEEAVERDRTWFIFGAYKQIDEREKGVEPETNIGSPNWTLQGYTDGLPNYMTLVPKSSDCIRVCPFSYLLATVHQVDRDTRLQPNIYSQANLRNSIYDRVADEKQDRFIQQAKLPSLIISVHQYLKQQWLRPIIDFSVPTDLVYNRIPAWELLDKNIKFKTQIVIIGSGGYSEAGLSKGSDNLSTPSAIGYWNARKDLRRGETPFTGSEVLAYMTYQWLNRRLVVPIPELWAVLIALLIAKSIKLSLRDNTFTVKWLLIWLFSAATVYGLIVLQLYISNAILLPWLLPSAAVVTYLSKK